MCRPACRRLRWSAQSTSSCPFNTLTHTHTHRWVCGLFISKPGADFRFCICHTAGLVSGLTLSLLANSYSYWAVLGLALPLHTLSVLILRRRISAACLSTLPLLIPTRAAHIYLFHKPQLSLLALHRLLYEQLEAAIAWILQMLKPTGGNPQLRIHDQTLQRECCSTSARSCSRCQRGPSLVALRPGSSFL